MYVLLLPIAYSTSNFYYLAFALLTNFNSRAPFDVIHYIYSVWCGTSRIIQTVLSYIKVNRPAALIQFEVITFGLQCGILGHAD